MTEYKVEISIDEDGHSYLKNLLDDIFNVKNFISNFIWQKKKGGGNAGIFYEGHEYLLIYTKDVNKLSELSIKDKINIPKNSKKYIKKDEKNYVINDDFIRDVFGKYEKAAERRRHYEDMKEKQKEEVDIEISKGNYILVKSKSDITKHYVARYELLDNKRKKNVFCYK